ncbi:MAG: hypothetical protein ABTQ26_00275 [Azonexus sp.]
MASVPFSWMWKDPALIADQLIGMRERMAIEEQRIKEQVRRKKQRHIRKLVKLAKAGQLKGEGYVR